MDQMSLYARGHYRVPRLTRTIADLAAREQIQLDFLAEALPYRSKRMCGDLLEQTRRIADVAGSGSLSAAWSMLTIAALEPASAQYHELLPRATF